MRYANSLRSIAAAIVLVCTTACSKPQMQVSKVYVVTPAAGMPAVLYATIQNTSGVADTLTSVSTPAAARAEVHETVAQNGDMHGMGAMHDMHGAHAMTGMGAMPMASMTMRPVAALPIAKAATIRIAPGGYHVMLMKPVKLRAGDSVDVTWRFARAKDIRTRAAVITYTEVETLVGQAQRR
jgi:hypothetical protein